jgi:drug/metabolite transporter (DMT)-like permease
MHMARKNPFSSHILAWSLLISLSFIWGSSYILMKKALVVFKPIEIVHLRVIMATLVMLPYGIRSLFTLNKTQYIILGIDGLAGTLLPLLFFAIAQLHIDSGIHGVLNALTPVFVLLIGFLFFKKKIVPTELLGIALSIAGTALLMMTEAGFSSAQFNYYILLSLLGSFLYGNTTHLIKHYLNDLKSTTIASIPLLLISIFSFIHLAGHPEIFTKIVDHPMGKQALSMVIIAGVINLGIGNLLWAELIKRTSPVFTSTESLLAPLVSLSWGLTDGEKLSWEHYIAAAIILWGVYFINRTEESID